MGPNTRVCLYSVVNCSGELSTCSKKANHRFILGSETLNLHLYLLGLGMLKWLEFSCSCFLSFDGFFLLKCPTSVCKAGLKAKQKEVR